MKELIEKIAGILYEKKAQNIVALDVSGMTVITDCMLIASGRSALQVKALADEVEDRLSELGIEPARKEAAGGQMDRAGLRLGARAYFSCRGARVLPLGQALGSGSEPHCAAL